MKAFVTGGTGFIGRRLVIKLVESGNEVFALVRSQKAASEISSIGAFPVIGNLFDKEIIRDALISCDVVFHLAAWYRVGSRNQDDAYRVNVEGTRNVLEAAIEARVPKIIYTSTLAVNGDTHGKLVDERYIPPEGSYLTEYDRTKSMAHFEVAIPLLQQGAPIIILMPGIVYGPGDTSLIGKLMQAYYRGWLFLFPAPEIKLTYAYVDDVVNGHLLAAELGKPGSTYMLAGPAAPLKELVYVWAEVTGKPAPIAFIPPAWLQPFAPVVDWIGKFVALPELISRDGISLLNVSYLGRSDKARSELGWQLHPIREGMRTTFDWIAKQELEKQQATSTRKTRTSQAALIMLLAAFSLVVIRWLSLRKKFR
jgi:nucleoside-diphosphate-sugar epimerase